MSEIFYREMPLETREASEDGILWFSASSETPVMRWGDQEILRHDAASVRMERLNSLGALLVNHDPDQRAGSITEGKIKNGQLRIGVKFLSTDFGKQIAVEVAEGALRGVSVGYAVHQWEIDEEARTVTAIDWEPYEVSLTPIPADASVGIGRNEKIDQSRWQEVIGRNIESTKPQPAAMQDMKGKSMSDTTDPQVSAEDIAKLRSDLARVQLDNAILQRCGEFKVNLDPSKFDSIDAAQVAITRELVKQQAVPAPAEPVGPSQTKVIADDSDKRMEAVRDGLLDYFNLAEGTENKGLRSSSILDLGREYLRANGIKAPAGRVELATMLNSRAANVSSADFSTYIQANVMDKAVLKGYGAAHTTYDRWCTIREVNDFKNFVGGALDRGNLIETAENVAFPELTKAEGGYNDSLSMWGATVSLTFQAYVNDDLGEFARMLSQAGAIAAKTVEKQVYTAIEAFTWTNYRTVTGAIGTAGNLGKGVAGFMDRTGPSGEKIGLEPRFWLVPSGLYETALKLTTQVQGATERVVNDFLTPVITPFLSTDATASNSDSYLTADPNDADTLVVAFLRGMRAPLVVEYDAGATAARKWKIMLPFKAVVPTTPVGMHMCDVA